MELPARPAVREHERISISSGRLFSRREIVQENVSYTVFPPDSGDAVHLTFLTDMLDYAARLVAEADGLAPTLQIILGDADAD